MEQEPLFKTFLIIKEVKSIVLEDLRKALGSPMVLTKKFVRKLEDIGVVETDELGTIKLTSFESEKDSEGEQMEESKQENEEE
jgi:Mn-dependent DtxR family transcriptional regulator